MAKDPRFNFYPDNWSGGTKRMTFEQKGAYMELLLLNFYCFSDGLPGFTEDEALNSLAHAAAYTELWKYLIPKFKTDGKYFWSERMQKEFHKSKKHSEEQTKRANKRWNKQTADAAASACNGTGIGNGTKEDLNKKESSKNDSRETDTPRHLVWNDELYQEVLERLCKSHKVSDLQGHLDRWEGWYMNKFEWRKKDLQDMRKSFEAWLKDPKSQDKKTNGTKHATLAEIQAHSRNV